MILINATLKYKGYDPLELTKGFHKRVCCSCDQCGRIRWIPFKNYKGLCKFCNQKGNKHSEETLKKMSDIKIGKNNYWFGKKHSNKTKELMRNIVRPSGKDHPMYGIHRYGKDAPGWKGGIAGIKDHLIPINQCIQLNKRFKNSEGHHIMSSIVIFIPKDIHKSVWHNMKSGLRMKEINELTLQYLIGDI